MSTLPGFEPIEFNYYSLPPLSGLSNLAPVGVVLTEVYRAVLPKDPHRHWRRQTCSQSAVGWLLGRWTKREGDKHARQTTDEHSTGVEMTKQETYVRAYCPTYNTTFNITSADMARDCTWLFTGWLKLANGKVVWTTFAEPQLRDFELADIFCSTIEYGDVL